MPADRSADAGEGTPERVRLDEHRLRADLARVASFSRTLIELEEEIEKIRVKVEQEELKYFTSDEHDEIESVLFRYLVYRESLWDMISYYGSSRERVSNSELQTRGFLVGLCAGVHLAYYSSEIVASFLNQPVVINKLNEAFYRVDIPRGTYDKLFDSVTSLRNMQELKTAWLLYSNERSNPDSTLSRISETDPVYRELMEQIDSLYTDSEKRTEYILRERSLFLPAVVNRLRHAKISELAGQAKGKINDDLYAARSVLFKAVSRMKSPLAAEISFTPEQVEQIRTRLRPGDVILTFSEGYMSNIFLPGTFKHGITYVGSPGQRQEAGLSMENLSKVPSRRRDELSKHLDQDRLPSGNEADLVEAIAEGVVFSSLDSILKTHINRMVVLRPRLSEVERIAQLTTVFLLLGNTYDFKFDFSDASFHCCTEVIYRSLHQRGIIEFSLTERVGKQTLSADDIVMYYLLSGNKPFEFIFLAEEDPDASNHQAIIRTGSVGEERLVQLMSDRESS